MSSDLIHTARDGASLTVTLNRPDKANALTPAMLNTLAGVFREAAQDDTLRAVIVTGAGARVFCAGADLTSLYDTVEGPDPWNTLASALHDLPVLSIAAINGPCMGGGLTLALGCDMRIAVPDARFSYPVLKNNVRPAQYDVTRMRALVGPGRAAAILLGGDVIDADEASDWGLVDRIVPKADLLDHCHTLCAPAMAADRAHLTALKSMLGEHP